MGNIFRILFYQPTFNLLIFLYNLFSSNLGLAIIFVAALSRIITFPITQMQLKAAKKGKEFQTKYEKLKKKYSKNQQKLTEELGKLQAQYLPQQLAGCLPIILLIILLVQVRAGIVHLVDKGWHAFNEVTYSESQVKQEDSVIFAPETGLADGGHVLKISITASDGNTLEKVYEFEVTGDAKARFNEIKDSEKDKSENEKSEELHLIEETKRLERDSDISIYSELIEENTYRVPVSKFLFFTSSSRDVYLIEEKQPTFELFIRPPSDETIEANETSIYLDDVDVTEKAEISQGEALNLSFFGIDLSKVAADFSLTDPQVIPYIILALFVAGSQFATTKILSGLRSYGAPPPKAEPEKKKGKKDEKDMPDMSEMVSMFGKQYMMMIPLLTLITSLGYMGGSNIFPSGISIFWTVQSVFVIIQQLIMNRDKVVPWIKEKTGRGVSENSQKDVGNNKKTSRKKKKKGKGKK